MLTSTTNQRRRGIVWLALTLAGAAGCSSPGRLVQRHEPGAPAGVTHVTEPGTYGLFVAGDDEPQHAYPLRAGDRIGFESTSTPAPNTDDLKILWLYGIAGAHRGRLGWDQTYEWRLLDDR